MNNWVNYKSGVTDNTFIHTSRGLEGLTYRALYLNTFWIILASSCWPSLNPGVINLLPQAISSSQLYTNQWGTLLLKTHFWNE